MDDVVTSSRPSDGSRVLTDERRSTWPAGWPLRHLRLSELVALIAEYRPALVELAKDSLDHLSIKDLEKNLSALRNQWPFETSFAGTTDLVACAGLDWLRYRQYLSIQVAQARFLEAGTFRLLLGKASPDISTSDVIRRIVDVCADLAPMQAAIEIHASLESQPEVLSTILRETPVTIVLDLENMRRGGLTLDAVLDIVPAERIAYVHHRNLDSVWTEDPLSVADERRCASLLPQVTRLWEPKTATNPEHILGLYREHHSAD